MTSSTFKSMGGVKIVALQNPNCLQVPARPAVPFQHYAGQDTRSQDIAQSNNRHYRPIGFDLDSDSDTPTCGSSDRHQHPKLAANPQYQPVMHEVDEFPAPSSRNGPYDQTPCATRRNMLGRLAVEVVGLSFYKAAASQHRVEGASVYLVRISLFLS